MSGFKQSNPFQLFFQLNQYFEPIKKFYGRCATDVQPNLVSKNWNGDESDSIWKTGKFWKFKCWIVLRKISTGSYHTFPFMKKYVKQKAMRYHEFIISQDNKLLPSLYRPLQIPI